SMTVRTDDHRSVRLDLKDYAHIDHGYVATIHKAQGMTVDRTHVLATQGLDAHGSYVALSRHRDRMDLHYASDDFATRDRLVRTLSRDRAKDMASDYERVDPAQAYAERRGITFRERVVEIVRRIVPEKLRDRIGGLLGGLRSPGAGEPMQERGPGPGRENVGARIGDAGPTPGRGNLATGVRRDVSAPVDGEAALRSARTKALVRHARALDAILSTGNADGSSEQMRELRDARSAFEKVRPHGWRDAEAAYVKDPELVREAGAGRVNRIVLALQLETEIRTGMDLDPGRRADRFVELWQKLDRTGREQYQAGDMSGYKSTRMALSDMAKSLERDPQLESLLANRKRELGIHTDSGRRVGAELAFSHGIGRGQG
ncbi:MAG: Ti-type conjugative transfer relaxase TraA, partial [Mesorhizobium sp.]